MLLHSKMCSNLHDRFMTVHGLVPLFYKWALHWLFLSDVLIIKPFKSDIIFLLFHLTNFVWEKQQNECADSEDADQTRRMPRVIWVFAGHTVILLVLSHRSSYMKFEALIWSACSKLNLAGLWSDGFLSKSATSGKILWYSAPACESGFFFRLTIKSIKIRHPKTLSTVFILEFEKWCLPNTNPFKSCRQNGKQCRPWSDCYSWMRIHPPKRCWWRALFTQIFLFLSRWHV